MDISVGWSEKARRLGNHRLILSLAAQHPISTLRSQTVGIIYRKLLVLLRVNIGLVIQAKSNIKLYHIHTVVMTERSELNSVKLCQHLQCQHMDSWLLDG